MDWVDQIIIIVVNIIDIDRVVGYCTWIGILDVFRQIHNSIVVSIAHCAYSYYSY